MTLNRVCCVQWLSWGFDVSGVSVRSLPSTAQHSTAQHCASPYSLAA
jgi:hypothetical protein